MPRSSGWRDTFRNDKLARGRFPSFRLGIRCERLRMPVPRTKRHFQLVLIRPSQYDDRGRVVQTSRSSVPANSLACLYALALDAAERQVLGSNIAIDITAVDES